MLILKARPDLFGRAFFCSFAGMGVDREPLLETRFEGEAIEWRGPAPFVFVALPEALAGEVRYAARQASYGWGCVPVLAEIGGIAFQTSLFPRGESYLLPLKLAVRRPLDIALGDRVAVRLRIVARGLRPPL